jgi:hypothetical protein
MIEARDDDRLRELFALGPKLKLARLVARVGTHLKRRDDDDFGPDQLGCVEHSGSEQK